MDLIADILLVAGAVGAALYCLVLSRRLKRFTDLEHGVGGAVAVLSVQVDELKAALENARETAASASDRLEGTTKRAEDAAHRLELLMASSNGDKSSVYPTGAASGRKVRRRRREPSQDQATGTAA